MKSKDQGSLNMINSNNTGIKRRKMEKSSLHDITNSAQNHLRGKVSIVTKPLLNNQTVSMIAQKKREKIKALKTFNQLHKLNIEKNWNIVRYQTKYIPDMNYQISKRRVMCQKLEQQINNYKESYKTIEKKMIDAEIESTKSIEKLEEEQRQSYQRFQDKFKRHKQEVRDTLEKEVKELENMKPKDTLLKEISTLENQFTTLNTELKEILQRNKDMEEAYKVELQMKFKKVKSEKTLALTKMEMTIARHLEIQDKLITKRNALNKENDDLEVQCNNQERDVSQATERFNTIDKETEELKSTLKMWNDNLLDDNLQFNNIQKEAKLHEIKYNENYDKMEEEQLKRKKLENSIDEMKGFIRTFLYIEPTTLSEHLDIDYAYSTVMDKDHEDEIYFFNRILPSNHLTTSQLITQEYKAYHDMCLKNGEDFNLFTVSGKKWYEVRDDLIEFMTKGYGEKYSIFFQNVYISDKDISKDLLLSTTVPDIICKEGTELNSGRSSINLNSFSTCLNNNNTIKFDDENRNSCSDGINLMKFQLTEKTDSTRITNFYLIQIDEVDALKAFENYLSGGRRNEEEKVDFIIRKLISDTKSCFIFKLEEEGLIQDVLSLSKRIGKIPNPKKFKYGY